MLVIYTLHSLYIVTLNRIGMNSSSDTARVGQLYSLLSETLSKNI